MYTLQVIVLAAGKSSRFKSRSSKLVEQIGGHPMITYPITAINSLHERLAMQLIAVVGHQKELIEQTITAVCIHKPLFVVQQEQQGTGHALLCTRHLWQSDDILIINGDMPLITPHIIQTLYDEHKKTDATLSFVIAHNPDPSCMHYGRVIKKNKSIEIVEGRHFTGDTHEFCCVNAGIYMVKREFLQTSATLIEQHAISKEFYLTDLVKIASDRQMRITTVSAPFDLIRGVNTHKELCDAQDIKRLLTVYYWMEQGVICHDPKTISIDANVSIGEGTVIGRDTHILNGSVIGKNVSIGPSCIIDNTIIKDQVIIKPFSMLKEATIDEYAQIGPFAHIQEKTFIGAKAIIGNFVEVKRTTIGAQTKAKHLAYLADADIGKNVNIGAGSITCNHNGFYKNRTNIDDNAYVGSNSTLIAPITINQNAIIGAGSTITENVPENSLAIARTRQINKPNYAQKLRKKYTALFPE